MDIGEIYKVLHKTDTLPLSPYSRPCYYMVGSIREDDREYLVIELVKVHADHKIWVDNWSISIKRSGDLQHLPFTFELWARP